MDIMQKRTLEAINEKGGKVISCKFVTMDRDTIGSGLYKARYLPRGFEETVDDTGSKNYAAIAGVHRCEILMAKAMQARSEQEKKRGQY